MVRSRTRFSLYVCFCGENGCKVFFCRDLLSDVGVVPMPVICLFTICTNQIRFTYVVDVRACSEFCSRVFSVPFDASVSMLALRIE